MSRRSSIVLLTMLVAGVAVGQHWEFEQVDTAPWGGEVQMRRHPDGRLFLCYSNDSGDVRLAWKDSTWCYEDVPLSCPMDRGTNSLDIGPAGELGVAYSSDDELRLALRTDSGWVDTATSLYWMSDFSRPAAFAFDSRSRPMLLVDACRRGPYWATLDTGIWRWQPLDSWPFENTYYLALSLGQDREGKPWAFYIFDYTIPAFYDGTFLKSARMTDSGWTSVTHAGGYMTGFEAWSADLSDAVHIAYDLWVDEPMYCGFYYDGYHFDTMPTYHSALVMDSLGRPLIAHSRREGLGFRFRDSLGWHADTIDRSEVASVDLLLAHDGQPIVGYSKSDGVWIAKGVDVLGIAGATSADGSRHRSREATVVTTGALVVREENPMSLLDMVGRKVMDLKPGENDIRHLAPGVYFVHEPTADSRQLTAVSKVVIQR